MVFVIKTEEMKKAVNTVYKAIPGATTMEIMECIMMEVDDNNLKLTANNHEIGIQTDVPVVIQESGKVCVNGKLLQKIVSANPDAELMIEDDDHHQVFVRSASMKFDLPGIAGDDFTMPPIINKENSVFLQKEDFREAVKKTGFCCKENVSNISLTGITLKLTKDHLRFSATNGHQLAVRSVKLSLDNEKEHTLVIPVKTMRDVASIITEAGDMEITYTEHQCMFCFDGTVVTSRLLYTKGIGDMPKWDNALEVSTNRIGLLNALSNALLLETGGENKPLCLGFSHDAINLSYKSKIGKWNGKLDAYLNGDESIRLGINARYLSEMLKCIDDENVVLHFAGAKSPIYFYGDDFAYVLMPMII